MTAKSVCNLLRTRSYVADNCGVHVVTCLGRLMTLLSVPLYSLKLHVCRNSSEDYASPRSGGQERTPRPPAYAPPLPDISHACMTCTKSIIYLYVTFLTFVLHRLPLMLSWRNFLFFSWPSVFITPMLCTALIAVILCLSFTFSVVCSGHCHCA